MKSVMCFYFAKTSHKSNITGLKTAKSASVSTEKLYRKIFHNKQKQIQRVLLVRCNRADYLIYLFVMVVFSLLKKI